MSPKEVGGVRVEEAPEGKVPKCPSCSKRLDRVWIAKKGLGVIEQAQILVCPYCETLIGYGALAR